MVNLMHLTKTKAIFLTLNSFPSVHDEGNVLAEASCVLTL